jgi:two-component system OmpR family response regulator
MEVALVRWPEDEERLERLRAGHLPRLLLVEEDAPPPLTADPFEDWVRLPASDTDVRARVECLRTRTEGSRVAEPTLDHHDVLRFGDGWVSVPPVEARLLRRLIERYGSVVGRDVLTHVGWPDREPGRNALDVHVLRLRRRIEPVGLVVRTVRSRGYLLEAATTAARN